MDSEQRSLLVALSGPRGSGKKTHIISLAESIATMNFRVVQLRIAPLLYPTKNSTSRDKLMRVLNSAYMRFEKMYKEMILPALSDQGTIVLCRGYVADFFARYAVITGAIPIENNLVEFFARYPLLKSAAPPDLTFWFDVHRGTYRTWRQRINDPGEFERNEEDFLKTKIAYDEFFGEVSPSKRIRLYEEEYADRSTVDFVIHRTVRNYIDAMQE